MSPVFKLTALMCLCCIFLDHFMVLQAAKVEGMPRGKTTSGPDKFPMGLTCSGKRGGNDHPTTKRCCKEADVRCGKHDAGYSSRPKISCVVNNTEEKDRVKSCCTTNENIIGSADC